MSKDNFMPPAIVPRLQPACTTEYRRKEIRGKTLLFYKKAVFSMNVSYNLFLEEVQHVICVTVVSLNEEHVSSCICESGMFFSGGITAGYCQAVLSLW